MIPGLRLHVATSNTYLVAALFRYSFLCHANTMDPKESRRRIQKNLQNSFSRKRKTIVRKIDALYSLDSDMDMYFVLRRRGRLYTYISSETASWPPTKEQIASHSIILHLINTNIALGPELPLARKADAV
jgi:hypothetical protein